MAFPTSALSVATFVDALDVTQLALDLDSELHKVALFTNSIAAPDMTVDTAYAVAPWNANEVTGTGYTAGGVTLTGTTFVHSATGVCVFDASDSSWTTATWAAARGCDIYANALSPKAHIAVVNFGADFGVSAGTFTIQWNAGGIFSIDFIP